MVKVSYNTVHKHQQLLVLTGNGGSYDNLCDATGIIYLEVDLQTLFYWCNSLDGYSGLTTTSCWYSNFWTIYMYL
jgi:hypothetical protein